MEGLPSDSNLGVLMWTDVGIATALVSVLSCQQQKGHHGPGHLWLSTRAAAALPGG